MYISIVGAAIFTAFLILVLGIFRLGLPVIVIDFQLYQFVNKKLENFVLH